jgi:hypothetical protein
VSLIIEYLNFDCHEHGSKNWVRNRAVKISYHFWDTTYIIMRPHSYDQALHALVDTSAKNRLSCEILVDTVCIASHLQIHSSDLM